MVLPEAVSPSEEGPRPPTKQTETWSRLVSGTADRGQ